MGMGGIDTTTNEQVYRQIREYRDRYPQKAILHQLPATLRQAWVMLMAGCSMFIGQMAYPENQDPPTYIPPELCQEFLPTYSFIRNHLATILPNMSPRDKIVKSDKSAWCLADSDRSFLIFAIDAGHFQVDLSTTSGSFTAKWFDPGTGEITENSDGLVKGGSVVDFTAPAKHDWALWLNKEH
jgi:hypothetical protein